MSAAHPHDKSYKVDCDLVSWLRSRDKADFPQRTDYVVQFDRLRAEIDKILPDVGAASAVAEAQKLIREGKTNPEEVLYLTNHGEQHVDQVIQRATDILNDSNCGLSPYEGYILLAAILFHDVGNIFGRKDHAEKGQEIMNALGRVAGTDAVEKRLIIKIAVAHQGSFGGSKDTISRLQDEDILGKRVRERLLAAILRFADELADDCSRASRYMFEADRIPESSVIFHAYSASLNSVRVEQGEIRLRFHLDEEQAIRKYLKNGQPTFLLDEINGRVLKMHRERMYCMRFMRPYVDNEISRIRVDITVFAPVKELTGRDDFCKKSLFEEERIQYILAEGGYPECPDASFLEHCSEKNYRTTGAEMKSKLETKRSMRNV